MADDLFSSNTSLQIAIIKIIAFFDLFEYPLTAYEIWNNLDRKSSFNDVVAILESGSGSISYKQGFYFLPQRADIINTRRKRYNYAYRKIKIARRFAKLFGYCPWVQAVAVANSLGQYNLRDGSDIDFFIITSSERIWLSRLYCTGLAKILNSRPTAEFKKDKVCLSFYVSMAHLDISGLRLTGGDPYFDYWRRNLIVLYNKDRTYEHFLSANGLANDGTYFPPASFQSPSAGNRAPGKIMKRLEDLAKRIQLNIMPLALTAAMNNSDGVVINDAVLKLYQGDRRREYAEKYGQKINEIFEKNR